jgi:hypothetical protein
MVVEISELIVQIHDSGIINTKLDMVVHTYNPSYLGGGDLEDHDLRFNKQTSCGGTCLSSQLHGKQK